MLATKAARTALKSYVCSCAVNDFSFELYAPRYARRSCLNLAPLPIDGRGAGPFELLDVGCKGRRGDLHTAWHIRQSPGTKLAVNMTTL